MSPINSSTSPRGTTQSPSPARPGFDYGAIRPALRLRYTATPSWQGKIPVVTSVPGVSSVTALVAPVCRDTISFDEPATTQITRPVGRVSVTVRRLIASFYVVWAILPERADARVSMLARHGPRQGWLGERALRRQ